ncbi:MAG: phasin family protein [Rhodospirillales bacterium]
MATKPKAAKVAAPGEAPAAPIEIVAAVIAAPVPTEIALEPAPIEAAPIEAAPIDAAPIDAAPIDAATVSVEQPMEKVVKTTEDFVAFGQGNIEAFVKSSQIWSAGVQDLSKQVAATAQAQMDETMSAFKAIAAVKSFKDMFELQSAFAKSAMEKTMAESGKLTDASLKLTEQAIAPIAARMTVAVETFKAA